MSTTEEIAETVTERKGNRRLMVIGSTFAAVMVIIFGYRWLVSSHITTDDAMVDADVVAVPALVGGPVASVAVPDNARVKKGQIILQIDPAELQARETQVEGDFAAARAQAEAADAQETVAEAAARGGLSAAQAQVATARAAVGTAEAQLASAHAQLLRAQAEMRKMDADLLRGQALADVSGLSGERLDALNTGAQSAHAAEASAASQVVGAEDALAVARSRVAEAGGALDANEPIDAKIASARAAADLAHARVTSAAAALDLAKLALTRATVTAPADGTLAKLSVHPGSALAPGQLVAYLVPDTTYVVANFKETQIGDMRAGQRAEFTVDGHPGESYEGTVESLAAGTGSRFAMLAPDNASGNFVKVVQRVSVRIRPAARPQDQGEQPLRPGESAEVTVFTGG